MLPLSNPAPRRFGRTLPSLMVKDKARGKAMTLSNGNSLDFYKANALRREGKCFLCEQKGHQAKDCTGEKKDGGASSEKSKFKTKKDF